jgi:alpha-tubulin suppressor-like RCC1 family protein
MSRNPENLFLVMADTQGRCYAWGVNSRSGILGHSDKKPRATPEVLIALKTQRVTNVAAGFQHMLALTEAGHVFSWGHGDFGVLGLGDKKPRNTPTRVTGLSVTAEVNNTSRTPSRGAGSPKKHRRNQESTDFDFKDEKGGEQVVEIACGNYHSLAVTYEGHVFSWGKGSAGQLGHGDTKDVENPKQVLGLIDDITITNIAAGACHTVAFAAATGQIFTWGQGSGGSLGHGTEDDLSVPTLVQAISIQEDMWRETVAKTAMISEARRDSTTSSADPMSRRGSESDGASGYPSLGTISAAGAKPRTIPVRTRLIAAGGPFSFALQERVAPGEVFDTDA